MVEVYARAGEDIDSLLRRFNRKVMLDGILVKAREYEFFKGPSRKRHEADCKRRFRNRLNKQKSKGGINRCI